MGTSKEIYVREKLLEEIEELSKLNGYWSDVNITQDLMIKYHGIDCVSGFEMLVTDSLVCVYLLKDKSTLPINFCQELKHSLIYKNTVHLVSIAFEYARSMCFSNIEIDDWYLCPSSFKLKIKIYNE